MPILEKPRLIFNSSPDFKKGGGFTMFLKNSDLGVNGVLVFKSEPPQELCQEFLKELEKDFGLKSLGIGYVLFDMLKGKYEYKNAFPLLRNKWKEEYV